MRLPCHGECYIPEGLLEREREKIDAELRTDLIERIDHRNFLMGFGHDAERATIQYEEQILGGAMTYQEAKQLLSQMHSTNMRMVERARDQATKKI